jgi:hypothetical protein
MLIGKPTERSQGNESIRANNNQTTHAVVDTRETTMTPDRTNAVFEDQMPSIHLHSDTVSRERYDAAFGRDRCEIAVLKMLRYVLNSCHRRVTSMVVRACRLLQQPTGPFFFCVILSCPLRELANT